MTGVDTDPMEEDGLAEVDDFLIFEGDDAKEVAQRQLSINGILVGEAEKSGESAAKEEETKPKPRAARRSRRRPWRQSASRQRR